MTVERAEGDFRAPAGWVEVGVLLAMVAAVTEMEVWVALVAGVGVTVDLASGAQVGLEVVWGEDRAAIWAGLEA